MKDRCCALMSDLANNSGNDQLARLGIEIWRLGQRVERGDIGRVRDSYDRLLRAFADLGGRIEDRAGEPFIDGMVADILDQPPGVDPADGSLVWAETIRPGVHMDGRQVISPQVILKEQETRVDAAETHD